MLWQLMRRWYAHEQDLALALRCQCRVTYVHSAFALSGMLEREELVEALGRNQQRRNPRGAAKKNKNLQRARTGRKASAGTYPPRAAGQLGTGPGDTVSERT
jgi:hypothetical protein